MSVRELKKVLAKSESRLESLKVDVWNAREAVRVLRSEIKRLTPDYSVRKHGDNYGLYFRGQLCESGVFATRATALKHMRIAENERRARTARTENT